MKIKKAAETFSLVVLTQSLGIVSAAAPEFTIQIGQHNALPAPITAAVADAVLADVNKLFAANGCAVSMQRSGPIVALSDPPIPFSLNGQSDFDNFKPTPPSLKITGEINWCSGLGIGIVGCSSLPGPAWTVVRYTASQEAMLWAHEFSHTTGNPHRSDPNALMRPVLQAGNTNISPLECAHLTAGSPAVISGIGAANLDGPPISSQTNSVADTKSGTPEPVREFVKGAWFEGIPYGLAKRYSNDDVAALQKILNDRHETSSWRAAVGTLGAIGTKKAQETLMEFLLANPNGVITSEIYLAKSTVPVAMGWTVARSAELTGDAKKFDVNTLNTLIQMSNAEWWSDVAKINWTTPIHKTRKALIRSLVVKAIIGLTLSGTQEGRLRIVQIGTTSGKIIAPTKNELNASMEVLGSKAFDSMVGVSSETKDVVTTSGGDEFIKQMLAESDKVRKRGGLDGYYGVQ